MANEEESFQGGEKGEKEERGVKNENVSLPFVLFLF